MKTNIKLPLIITTTIAILLFIGFGILFIKTEKNKVKRIECLSTLRSIGTTLALYCNDYKGNLPPNLSLMSEYISDANFFTCPRSSKKPASWNNIEKWMDYIYIPWSSPTTIYAKYPLMYDRRLSNHNGKGINILLVEQVLNPATPRASESFHGQFFWDEGAQ
jgi:hypothetical protein